MEKAKKIQKLGLILHPAKPEAAELALHMAQACRRAGVEPVEGETADADVIAVLGGDGTILRALGMMQGCVRPVLGVNLGHMGFLTECAPQAAEEAVRRLAQGEYRLETRMLLRVTCGENAPTLALNDVAVSRGICQSVLNARVRVDGQPAAEFAGDGLVIASPTGSTAYSISAGGPVVTPNMECIVISPVCPHTFSARPMVVSGESLVEAEIAPRSGEGAVMVSVDGAPGKMMEYASVRVERAQERLPFVRFEEDRFFESLRGKLSLWGGMGNS